MMTKKSAEVVLKGLNLHYSMRIVIVVAHVITVESRILKDCERPLEVAKIDLVSACLEEQDGKVRADGLADPVVICFTYQEDGSSEQLIVTTSVAFTKDIGC